MIVQNKQSDLKSSSSGTYWIKTLESRKDAKRITDYLLDEDSFDDRNFTKGEVIQIKSLPYKSLEDTGFQFWYAENNENEIIGVISLRENEQISGGYFIDYITVHKQYRNRGIAQRLMDVVIDHVKSVNGRYVHANTCDTYLYESVRRLFEKNGFFLAGHLPDYYFAGEGMLVYFKKI